MACWGKRQRGECVSDRIDGQVSLGRSAGLAPGSATSASRSGESAAPAADDLVKRAAVRIRYSQVENDEPAGTGRGAARGDQRFLGDVLRVVVAAAQSQRYPEGHDRAPVHEKLIGVEVAVPLGRPGRRRPPRTWLHASVPSTASHPCAVPACHNQQE